MLIKVIVRKMGIWGIYVVGVGKMVRGDVV